MNVSRVPHPSGIASDLTDADRRSSSRHCTVYRIATIEREGDAGFWRVRNISDEGMMLAANVQVDPGERLQIALSDSIRLSGEVVWAENGRCGVAFDTPINAAELLKQLAAGQKASGYRPPRLAVRGHATIVTDDGPREIDVVNLSQQGAGLVHDGELEVGMKLELVLWGGIRRRGIVRWSRQGQSGVWLTAPLEQADLESIRRFED